MIYQCCGSPPSTRRESELKFAELLNATSVAAIKPKLRALRLAGALTPPITYSMAVANVAQSRAMRQRPLNVYGETKLAGERGQLSALVT